MSNPGFPILDVRSLDARYPRRRMDGGAMSANEIPRATCAFKLLSFNCGGSDELVSSSAALSSRRYKSENSAEPYSPSLGLTALLQCWSVRRARCAQSFIKGSYKSERVQWPAFRDRIVMLCRRLRENRDAIQSWRRREFLFPKISRRPEMPGRRPASIPARRSVAARDSSGEFIWKCRPGIE
jgi:hypothetical protein